MVRSLNLWSRDSVPAPITKGVTLKSSEFDLAGTVIHSFLVGEAGIYPSTRWRKATDTLGRSLLAHETHRDYLESAI